MDSSLTNSDFRQMRLHRQGNPLTALEFELIWDAKLTECPDNSLQKKKKVLIKVGCH
jgi:hypothetical protein